MRQPEPDINEIAFRIVQAATAEKPVEETKPEDVSADRTSGKIRAAPRSSDEGSARDRMAAG